MADASDGARVLGLMLSPPTPVVTMPASTTNGGTMTTKQAIEKVLSGKRKMRVPAIIEAAVPLATGSKGKTPGQVIYSVLYSEAKKADGFVVKVDRGTFRPNPKRRSRGTARPGPVAPA
jgi:hypothetical protein